MTTGRPSGSASTGAGEPRLKLALDQCPPAKSGAAKALERLDRIAKRAADGGADILITPEMALTGYNIGPAAVRAVAEPEGGPMQRAVAEIAGRRGITILAGLPVLDPDGKVRNAILFVDKAGKALATYRKTHLYGEVDRTQFAAGPAILPPVELRGWRLGLAICYDIEFPEVARSLAIAGADAILVPTANMVPFDSVATRLVPARAEENAVFVAYANYCGSEGEFAYCGLSCVCSPDGRDLARAGRDETMIMAELARDELDRVRARSTHLSDRRPELYQTIARKGGLS